MDVYYNERHPNAAALMAACVEEDLFTPTTVGNLGEDFEDRLGVWTEKYRKIGKYKIEGDTTKNNTYNGMSVEKSIAAMSSFSDHDGHRYDDILFIKDELNIPIEVKSAFYSQTKPEETMRSIRNVRVKAHEMSERERDDRSSPPQYYMQTLRHVSYKPGGDVQYWCDRYWNIRYSLLYIEHIPTRTVIIMNKSLLRQAGLDVGATNANLRSMFTNWPDLI